MAKTDATKLRAIKFRVSQIGFVEARIVEAADLENRADESRTAGVGPAKIGAAHQRTIELSSPQRGAGQIYAVQRGSRKIGAYEIRSNVRARATPSIPFFYAGSQNVDMRPIRHV